MNHVDLLIDAVAAACELLVADTDDARAQANTSWDRLEARPQAASDHVPLAGLCRRFGLSAFERKCLVLALSTHVEPRMTQMLAATGRELFSRAVTVRLTLERFCSDPAERVVARRAFLSSGPLIKGRLVTLGRPEVGGTQGLMARRIELTTPTLRFLLEEDELSDAVATIARIEAPSVDLLNVILAADQLRQVRELVEHHKSYRQLITRWGFDTVLPYGRGVVLLFSGPSGTGKTLLAQALAGRTGRPLITLSAADIPKQEGVEPLLADLFAEAAMRDAIVLIDECEALLGKADPRKATAMRAIEDCEGIVVLTTNHPQSLDEALERRIIFHMPFEIPDAALRAQIWEVHLPPDVPLEGEIDLIGLANRYDFTGGTIKNAILVAVNRAIANNSQRPTLSMALLEEGCRSQLRYALQDLTVRTTTHMRLTDLVLPDESMQKINEMLAACRNSSKVMNKWGFGKRLVTGKGIVTLFDGPPGTGKTYTAEIVAGELDRPLYRVNIPEVVSKWVGETEKHIREIFQQARVSHAMLLFDEADSLFSSRVSDAKTSNDRYSNMEVNLLLQEIERFPGICILTTNFFGALDNALIRRIQFRVPFVEPDAEQREKIWKVLCPPETPLAPDVDFAALARKFELTGGMIKNSLLRAAYWAADGADVITQQDFLNACMDEYKAAGKVARTTVARGGPAKPPA